MKPDYIAVLYSKYSDYSKQLIQVIENQHPTIKTICVDNKDFRNKLLNVASDIKVVPCAVFFYGNGKVIEKFQGEQALQKIHEFLSQGQTFLPQPPPPQPQPPIQPVQQTPPPPPQPEYTPQTLQQPSATVPHGKTSIMSLQQEEPSPANMMMPIRQDKSLKERAAEMQAGRDNLDKPAMELKRELEGQMYTNINQL